MNGIRYVCRFVNASGEVHEVLVSLSEDEVADVLRHRAEGRAAGAPGGPLERGLAWHRAVKAMPPGCEPLLDQAKRVTVN
jgi:hypothetical protein